jgi:predicted house-cleaning noncanonical NTP pyrophosphatase (MazG superfamily)
MNTIIYNKLIRDKITNIMEEQGKSFEIEVLDDSTYIQMLNEKLKEEIEEYYKAADKEEVVGELSDIMEIVLAIADFNGISHEELEQERLTKKEKRGGFKGKIFLKSVTANQ